MSSPQDKTANMQRYIGTNDNRQQGRQGHVEEDADGNFEMVTPIRKRTQEEQDQADEKARQKAMKDLISSWQDRLQLITLITTFLASVEASMLQVTFPQGSDPNNSSTWSQAANAGFMASLVLHLYASFVSFFASFFLVRFKVQEAKREERQVEAGNPSVKHTPTSKGSDILDRAAHTITGSPQSTMHEKRGSHSSSSSTPAVWSCNPRLVQVGPFQHQPPVNLLSRCHTLCLISTGIGFIFAMIGTLCYAWDGQSRSVAIITSATMGLCLISCIGIGVRLPEKYTPSRFFMQFEH